MLEREREASGKLLGQFFVISDDIGVCLLNLFVQSVGKVVEVVCELFLLDVRTHFQPFDHLINILLLTLIFGINGGIVLWAIGIDVYRTARERV